MSKFELRQREIIEKNRQEIQEIEEIRERDEKGSQMFRKIMAGCALILFCLKSILALRTLFSNVFGGNEIKKGDVHYTLLHSNKALLITLYEFLSAVLFLYGVCIHEKGKIILKYLPYKYMMIICASLIVLMMFGFGIIGGLWLYGFNLVFVVVLWYADKTITDVDTQVKSFLNEHKYQN